MGLQDDSGNIYEMLEYTFFDHSSMGTWDTMMEGMVNVSVYYEDLLVLLNKYSVLL